MKDSLMNRYDLFLENTILVEKDLIFEGRSAQYFCALQCTMQQKHFDINKVKACKKIIQKNAGMFSFFRSTGNSYLATAISLHDDPEAVFLRMDEVYKKLHDHGFSHSTFLAAATIKLYELDDDALTRTMERAMLLHKEMQDNHPFLTNAHDYGFAIMLAMTDMDIAELTQNAELCYLSLKEHFSIGNATQSLSHVLAMSDKYPEDNCQRVMELYHGLEDNDCKFGKNHELATLGVLALLDVDTQALVNDIVEVNSSLLEVKGFGDVRLGRKVRLMLASMLVASAYAQEAQAKRSPSTIRLPSATVSAIVATNTAMLMAIDSQTAINGIT